MGTSLNLIRMSAEEPGTGPPQGGLPRQPTGSAVGGLKFIPEGHILVPLIVNIYFPPFQRPTIKIVG